MASFLFAGTYPPINLASLYVVNGFRWSNDAIEVAPEARFRCYWSAAGWHSVPTFTISGAWTGLASDKGHPMERPLVGPIGRGSSIPTLARPHNWDGEQAKAITQEACNAATEFLGLAEQRGFPEPDNIGPSVRGAVGLQWNRNGSQFSAKAFARTPTGFHVRTAGGVGRSAVTCGPDKAAELLGRFLEDVRAASPNDKPFV